MDTNHNIKQSESERCEEQQMMKAATAGKTTY